MTKKLFANYFSPDAICFPSDPICPTYQAPDYGDEYEEEEYLGDYIEEGELTSTMSDESCSNPNDTCATLNRCPDLVERVDPEIPEICGFDTKQSLLMVCCPTEAVKEAAEQLVQKPRFFPDASVTKPTLQIFQVSSQERASKEVRKPKQTLPTLEGEGLPAGQARSSKSGRPRLQREQCQLV